MKEFLPIKHMLSKRVVIPVVITLICLCPFAGKAFHIDDPMFIWSAKQIQINPVDFYGFSVNWSGTELPMVEMMQNPPVACYYIALAGSVFGWSEIALHLAFLIPAVAAVIGIYYLARQFCSLPVLATLAAVLTPVFLVSSTNTMCDTMMLALWVWAVVLWVRGIKADKQLNLFCAALLIAICALTKYFGMALLGLLFVYSLMQKRTLGCWALFLLIPVIILAGYEWATYTFYGTGLLSDATSFAAQERWILNARVLSKGIVSLSFAGGCIITALFYSPLLWSRRVLAGGIVLTILFIFTIISLGEMGVLSNHRNTNGIRWSFLLQLGLMAVSGVSLLGLAGTDFWRHRDADSMLLLLWMFGTFAFTGFINWMICARNILPMVPVGGILMMRQIDHRRKDERCWGRNWCVSLPLVPAALVALLVCWADCTLANTARTAAGVINEKLENRSDGAIWFQGHWGFQYYMEAGGGRALDFKRSKPLPGDIIIVPSNNSMVNLSKESMYLSEIFEFTPFKWLATMNHSLGAGFYADVWGQLPFAIGKVEPEKYSAFIVR